MEQLQGSLRSSLQGDTKTLKEIEYRRMCSKRTRRTSQCGNVHQDAAGPHPSAGESRTGYTSPQNIGRADHKDDIRAIEPSCYSHCKTSDRTIRELPAETIGTSFNPGQTQPLGVQKFDSVISKLKPRLKCVLQEQPKV